MAIADIITEIDAKLTSALIKWDVQGETILGAKDKLLEIRFGQFTIGYLDLGTQSIVGTIELAFYREFGSTYTDLMNDVETAIKSLAGLVVANTTILNQGATFATVQRPSILSTTKQSFYVVTVNLNFEMIL